MNARLASGGPLPDGKQRTVIDETTTGAGVTIDSVLLDADAALVALSVASISGSLDVVVTTEDGAGNTRTVATFATQTTPTSEIQLKLAAPVLGRVVFTCTYTDACEYRVVARGIDAGAAAADSLQTAPDQAKVPTVANVTMGAIGAESSYALPSGTKRFIIKTRDRSKLQLAYVSGDSGTTFIELKPGNAHEVWDISAAAAVTLYFQSSKAGTIAEIESWA